MVKIGSYRDKLIFRVVIAVLVSAFTYYITGALPYYPYGWRWLFVLIGGMLWIIKPTIGLIFTLLTYILPIAYNSITLLVPYLIFVLARVGGLYGFLVMATATISLFIPQLAIFLPAIPLMAGFSGSNSGAFLGAFVCLLIELITILEGKANVGVLVLGNESKPFISLHKAPVNSLLDFAWLKAAVSKGFDSSLLSKLFKPFIEHPILIAQIVLWSFTAGMIGSLLSKSKFSNYRYKLKIIGMGGIILLVGHLSLPILLLEGGVESLKFVFSVLISTVLVWLISPLLEVAPSFLNSPLRSEGRHEETSNENKKFVVANKEIPSDKWEDLAGIEEIREEINEAIKSQFDPKMREALLKMSVRPTRGILLFGPPGTGKTKIARIIAHEANASFFAISGTEFTSKWYGESEANLRRIFEEARNNRPAVLFFDEIEAFLPKRTEFAYSNAPERGIVDTFLAYTDGIGDLDGVLLVGATNYPNLIEPAALRPGRFDKVIYVSPPGIEGRYEILERYLKDKKMADDVDLHKLAERMERFTGADIQSVCAEAIRKAMGEDNKPRLIKMSDLESAMSGIKPSITFKMLKEYEALADQYGRLSKKMKSEEIVAKPHLSWDDVIGLDEVKEALRDSIEMPLTHPELFKEYKIKPSKGVLLFGPPGCGKTFIAKVVASEAKAHFLHVKGPELLTQSVGKTEEQLRELFIRARENAPCILFFDEIDAIADARGAGSETGTKILTQLLTEMDGVEELRGVVVIAATNRPDVIDPALMRPGRLDRILYVPPPNKESREALFKKELIGKPLAPDIDYKKLSDITDGYSSADIASICNIVAMDAAKNALKTGKKQLITTPDLEDRIRKTPPSLTESQIAAYESLKDKLQR